MDPIISVHDLHRSYGQVHALRGVTFDVKRGEVFGLLGPNGAGKTTTLETIEGLRVVQRGKVVVDGIDVAKDPYAVRRRVGIQLQDANFFESLNLIELLGLFAELYEKESHPRALLELVGLEGKARSRAKALSGGQRKRFSIALALVNDPVAVFLDEPTSGLDPQARRRLWGLVDTLRERSLTVVLTTHYIEEAEALCDRVGIMDEGRLLVLDTPRALVQALLDRGFHRDVEVVPATLEDVFLDLTGREIRDAAD
ncbi:MAG TPA: ABC transporter ATP-binding protein [Candidatus Dormibacteraeota bacterium]